MPWWSAQDKEYHECPGKFRDAGHGEISWMWRVSMPAKRLGLIVLMLLKLVQRFNKPGDTLIDIRRNHQEIEAGRPAVWIDHGRGTLTGGSDSRKDGCAIGY